MTKKIDISKFEKITKKKKTKKPKHPSLGLPIDWRDFELDKRGLPKVSFDLSDRDRENYLKILNTKKKKFTTEGKKIKEKLEKKLSSEFIRLYEKYRRAASIELGKSTSYVVLEKEKKYALQIVINCLSKEVTPIQVFEYWHEHIKNFANRNMVVPSLPFLSSPVNIDSVAIDLMRLRYSSKPTREQKENFSLNTLGDVSKLDRGLRSALVASEIFNMSINDDYLVSVQAYAMDLAAGNIEACIVPRNLRDMVVWCAENYFKCRG
jgi:hypothetical protein